MTEQDFRPEPARLAISAADRYARAGVRVDRDPAPADLARARLLAGQGTTAPPVVAAEPAGVAPSSAAGQPRKPSGRFAHYPLRRHGARIRVLGHADLAAAGDPRGEIAAAADYARSAAATADRAGMRDPAAASAIRDAIRALMAAGDTLTAAMHTWRPAP